MIRTLIRSVAVIAVLSAVALVQGCMSTQYALLDGEDSRFGSLQLVPNDANWNRAPQSVTQYLHSDSRIWTRDGILLDQLMWLAPIVHEQTLFVSQDPKQLVYPTFRKEMLPNEVEELVRDSLTRQLGSQASVTTSNLRPKRFAGERGIAFDLQIEFADSATQRGYAGAVIIDDALHVAIYRAAQLHYFDKHWPAASAVIDSASRIPANSNR